MRNRTIHRSTFDSDIAAVGRRLGMMLSEQQHNSISISRGVVLSVDKDKKLIDVTMDNGHVIREVDLDTIYSGDSGILVYPAINSTVILGFIEGRAELPFVVSYTTMDEMLITAGNSTIKILDTLIEINKGLNNGLVLIDKLTTKLNAFVDTYNGHGHGVATTGTASSHTGATTSLSPTADAFNAEDYENKKITQ